MNLRVFFSELKRRRVYRVAVVYAVVAFVIWQAAEIAFPALNLPPWTLTFVVVLTLLGFPIALVLAWAFDITPEGVRRTAPGAGAAPLSTRRGGAIVAAAGLAVVALVVAAGWFLLREDGGTSAGRTMLVVLPLENLGAAADEYFADGVSEEIHSRLSAVSALGVIGRTSARQYKDTDKTVSEIGDELGVDFIVDGSVRQQLQRGGRVVRVTTELIQVSDERSIWNNTYEGLLEDIFGVQTDIALRVAEALEVTLLEPERRSLAARPTENLRAYDYYLLGRDYLGQWEPRAIEQAIQHFRRAVEADSSYAQGYAGLAYAYAALGGFGGVHPNDSWPHARAAAERALALDEGLAEAHTALALEAMSHRYDWQAAREGFERALELNPSSVDALVWLGPFESGIWGRFDRAMEYLARAERLDPRSRDVSYNIGWPLLWAGRHEEAMAAFESLVALEPEYYGGHEGLAIALMAQGRTEEALAEAQTTMAVGDPNYDPAIGLLGYLYGRLGRRADALKQLERLDEMTALGRYVSPVSRAHVYAGLDEVDEAFAWLERGYEERTHWLIWLGRDPYNWDNLTSDPRFQDLVRRMDYPRPTAEAR
ncbi:MAG: tetratricopeptide repeat protein [Gemmatimonadota bacterium]|nr:MAG: tetratricopeptide repeat protein [Gemmatimonadota bacterium]